MPSSQEALFPAPASVAWNWVDGTDQLRTFHPPVWTNVHCQIANCPCPTTPNPAPSLTIHRLFKQSSLRKTEKTDEFLPRRGEDGTTRTTLLVGTTPRKRAGKALLRSRLFRQEPCLLVYFRSSLSPEELESSVPNLASYHGHFLLLIIFVTQVDGILFRNQHALSIFLRNNTDSYQQQPAQSRILGWTHSWRSHNRNAKYSRRTEDHPRAGPQ